MSLTFGPTSAAKPKDNSKVFSTDPLMLQAVSSHSDPSAPSSPFHCLLNIDWRRELEENSVDLDLDNVEYPIGLLNGNQVTLRCIPFFFVYRSEEDTEIGCQLEAVDGYEKFFAIQLGHLIQYQRDGTREYTGFNCLLRVNELGAGQEIYVASDSSTVDEQDDRGVSQKRHWQDLELSYGQIFSSVTDLVEARMDELKITQPRENEFKIGPVRLQDGKIRAVHMLELDETPQFM